MSGAKNGVAKQLADIEKRALYTHCYCHALNLAIADTMKQSKVCRDALDLAFEITKLIKFSPKKMPFLTRLDQKMKMAIQWAFTHFVRHWTVQGDSIESILSHYDNLNKLWEECLENSLQPDVKGRIIGVQTQMSKFSIVLSGTNISETVRFFW